MTDTITFLGCEAGRRASKMWMPDGTTQDYDAGWRFQIHQAPVADLAQLSATLTYAQSHATLFAIRGTFRGDAHAQTVVRSGDKGGPAVAGPGWYRRWLELFDDTPHHWMCIDIDGYTPPAGIDPVQHPETAVAAFIQQHLPPEFHGAAFHWQLSSSAGHARNAGVLKAHVWFWLDRPRSCAELTAWSDSVGPAIDRTLYRAVQAHYTALPVFAPGVVDPVPVRCGLVSGGTVALVITPAMLARAQEVAEGGGSGEMLDPRTKTGIVGAFCRAYSIESILAGPLADQFVFEDGSTRRLTWLKGGGASGGAFITDDRMHLTNTHNTAPSSNTALNAFDLVRIYCFGTADASADPLALVQMQTRPSYRAMCEWASSLPEVIGQMPRGPVVAPVVGVGEGTGGDGATTVTAGPAARVVDETLLFPDAQAAYFAGCIYVSDLHRIMAPDGQFYDQQRFNAIYGGRSFMMDNQNARTVRSAWEAFLESQALVHTKVHGCMFRPEIPPGAIVQVEGRRYVNTYVPIETRQVEGDVRPFLQLVEKMLPDPRDRDIILTYMASMLRNPGVKFQWWPVLQGTEGNGKTAFIRVMQHCIGHRYSHLPNTGEMARNGIKFNAWIINCLFLGFEEVYVPGRRAFLEEMKPIVTNDRMEVERKGVDQTMEDNRANGIMCTNHHDGVPVTTDSRRYAIFYTAQQSAADKERDGMIGDYFPDLYDWFYGRGRYGAGGASYGYAVVNWWLRTQYEIKAEFDPARGCQVAPKTSSSDAAIHNSLGAVEQEILEAIETGEPGFRGGWVSSKALDRLLAAGKHHIPRNKRRHVMQSIGYDWHPNLREGRLHQASIIDGGKPTLYIKVDSPAARLAMPGEILTAYAAAQQ